MNVKTMKKMLKGIPDNYELNITKIYILKGEEDVLECLLDNPIVGIVSADDVKQIRFVIEFENIKNFRLGEIKKI